MGFNNFTNNQNVNLPTNPSTSSNNLNAQTIPSLLIDYNNQYKQAQPIKFRQDIINNCYSVLLANKKSNCLLLGPAGSGKTAIAIEIARQIANNDLRVPKQLLNYKVYELPLANIVAGSGIVGQIEEKLQDVIDFAKNNPVILFIDEIHLLMSRDSTYQKIAQILKPDLASSLHVIGATTVQEHKKLLDDPAFSRRFSNIKVDEITKEQETEILNDLLPNLIKHYHNQVQFKSSDLNLITDISDQVLRPSTHRPDSGITLLDRTMGEAIVKKQNNLFNLKQAGQTKMQQLVKQTKANVTKQLIEKVANKIVSGNSQKPNLTKDLLQNTLSPVKGQDQAKTDIIKLLLVNNLGLFNQEKPLSIMLSGSSGVGKTMLTKLVAKAVTNTEPITLNLTEYNSSASITRIIGSSAGYVGSDSNRELPFDSLFSNPYQVILLDEFEKADPSVQRLFMRVLDEGKLQTSDNRIIDFSKTIIFATTNASHSNTSSQNIGFNTINQSAKQNLSGYFDSELLNRFSRVINFNNLTKNDFLAILKDNYHTLEPKILKQMPYFTKPTDQDFTNLANKFYDPSFGARPVKHALEFYLENQI